MANRGNWYPLLNQGVQWDEQGNPFYNTSDGKRSYIPPISAAQYRDDPRMLGWATQHGATIDYTPTETGGQPTVTNTSVPGATLLHNRGTWNSEEGGYDQGWNWTNILSMVVGGFIAAPAAIALMGGGAGAEAAVTTAASTGSVDAGVSAGIAAGGALPSTAIGTGLATLPEVAASGAVPAAFGVGTPIAAGAATGAGAGAGAGTGAEGAGYVASDVLGTEAASTAPGLAATSNLSSAALPVSAQAGLPAVAPSGAVPAALAPTAAAASPSALKRFADLAGDAGSLISGATQAAGQTQLTNEELKLRANNSNIAGQANYEDELIARAKNEQTERNRALANIYMASKAKNPSRSPFNTTPGPSYSDDYMNSLANLSTQGAGQLQTPARFGTQAQPDLAPYVPYKPDTSQSTLQRIGNWTGPALGITQSVLRTLYGR